METQKNGVNQLEKKQSGRNRKSGSILHVLSEEHVDIHKDLALSKVMRPIYISMACFGLIWKSHKQLALVGRCDLCTFHCCLTVLLVWLNALQYFATYDNDDTYGQVLFEKITGNLFALQMACGVSMYIYLYHKHIPYFLKQWENYKLSHGGLSLRSMTKHVFNQVLIMNVILVCFYILLSLFMLLSKQHIHVEILVPIHKFIQNPEAMWVKTLYSVAHLYLVMGWLQSIIFTACMCYLLNREFKQLSMQFLKAVQNDHKSNQAIERLRSIRRQQALFDIPEGHVAPLIPAVRPVSTFETEQYRKRHLALCKLVTRLDQIMSSYLLFLYLFAVPIVVFLLYGLWDFSSDEYNNNLTTLFVTIIRLVFFVGLVGSVTRAGASLAAAVSTSLCKTIVQS